MTNNEDQSLEDIIQELPNTFINEVYEASLEDLIELQQKTHCYNRKAVIDARIQKINYLSI